MRKYYRHKLIADYDNNVCYICGNERIKNCFGVMGVYVVSKNYPEKFNTDICEDCEKVVKTAKEQIKYVRGLK